MSKLIWVVAPDNITWFSKLDKHTLLKIDYDTTSTGAKILSLVLCNLKEGTYPVIHTQNIYYEPLSDQKEYFNKLILQFKNFAEILFGDSDKV